MIFALFLYYLLHFQSGLNINAPISMQIFPLKVVEKFALNQDGMPKLKIFLDPFTRIDQWRIQTLS